MNYTLNQLRIYVRIVEKESITKASEELFLTQPAVSIQLKKFQDQFPIPLTEVVGRKLFITDFGREIAGAAQKILDEVEKINYQTISYQGMLAGKLKISVVSTGKYVMPYFLTDFMNLHNTIDLNIQVTNKAQVIQSLENNEVDFAMVSVIPDQLKIKKIQLLQNKLYLVRSTRLGNSLDKTKAFGDYPLLYREEGSATRNAMENFIATNHLPTYKKIELTSNEAVKQAVIAGLGYSIMPLIGIKNELKNGDLEIVPFKGLPLITHWHLIWLPAKNLSPVASSYLEFIQKEKDRIITDLFSWFENY